MTADYLRLVDVLRSVREELAISLDCGELISTARNAVEDIDKALAGVAVAEPLPVAQSDPKLTLHPRERVVKLNLGCGQYPLRGWTNIDSDPASLADVFAELPPLPYHDECIEEIYAGHFLEHLDCDQAAELLEECWRVLVPGGRLGIVVPHTREIMRRYLSGESERFQVPLGHFWRTDDLDAVCAVFIYSTIQDTPHKWMYDETTLEKTITAAGFRVTGRIDGWHDSRIPCGAWWNLGLDAVKEG